MDLWKTQLLSLLASWTKSLRSLLPHSDVEIPSWGPTEEEILQAHLLSLTPLTVESVAEQVNGDNFLDDDESILSGDDLLECIDSTLLDTLEAVDLADAFCYSDL